MKKTALFIFSAIFISLGAAELIVDYSKQNKDAYKDFQSALAAAKSGDTIKILKVSFPIPDSIIIKNRSDITVDGMFNTFVGTEKLSAKNWQKISPGLWKREIRVNQGLSMRYFMVFNGKLNRMGRFFKAKCMTPYKKAEELKENEWTVIEKPDSAIKNTKLYSIYLKIDQSVNDITKVDIAEPRINQICGVELSGKCRNLTFKNMICRNYWNDGYNIHNTCINTVFDTVCAIDCGDDGISAHENSQIIVNDFVSIGNSTGICHIQKVTAVHTNCYIAEALGKDIYFKSHPTNLLNNTLKNVYVQTSSAGGVCLGAAKQDKLVIDKLTVVLENKNSMFYFIPDKNAKVSAANISVCNTAPKKMEEFRKTLFAKFNGEIEKNLSSR